MKNKRKKAIIIISIVIFSLYSLKIENPKALYPWVLFTLEAQYLEIRQLDYLNLIKQQLLRIGINLKLKYFNMSEIGFPATIIAFRDFDLHIMELPCNVTDDPFLQEFYTENGSLNLAGYHTSMDWDEELLEGKNEWYIQTGLEMTPKDSQERINLCWEWQHYMMDDILPILPLFTQKDNHSSFEFLFFNMREVRPYIGNRNAAPSFPSKTKGLLVRKAISYAINREEIRRVVLGDDYEIINHPSNPVMDEWLNPNSIRYCYNLDFAKKLMMLAGYDVISMDPFEYPDWQDICNGNPTTAGVNGFELIISIGFLTAISISVIMRKTRKQTYKKWKRKI